jgi:hypothetical protein
VLLLVLLLVMQCRWCLQCQSLMQLHLLDKLL